MPRKTDRIVIVGAKGQLGRALTDRLPESTPVDLPELDITDPTSVEEFDWSGVDVVYNAAAYTAVDHAENDPASAWAVNALGPSYLARAATHHDFTLVHASTEYVFDGTRNGPIPEEAPLCPVGVYAASKAAGELAASATPRHYVVRTSWLVGDGHNFVRTMLSLADRNVHPSVVNDQIGRPTFAVDLADALVDLVAQAADGAAPGTYHATGDGCPVSWAGLAKKVFEHRGHLADEVVEVTTAQYLADKPLAASRPANSVLSMQKINDLGIRTPQWTESLATFLGGAS